MPVLVVADVLHPVNNLPIELFLNREMCHGGRRRGAVPVLFAGSEPDHVTRTNLLNGPAFPLSPATSRCNDKRLTERMGVPRSSRPRFESDACALNQRRVRRLKERIDTYGTGEPIGRSLDRGLRAYS